MKHRLNKGENTGRAKAAKEREAKFSFAIFAFFAQQKSVFNPCFIRG